MPVDAAPAVEVRVATTTPGVCVAVSFAIEKTVNVKPPPLPLSEDEVADASAALESDELDDPAALEGAGAAVVGSYVLMLDARGASPVIWATPVTV